MLALDSNVLVYAEAAGDDARLRRARLVVEWALRRRVVLPAQVLAELYRVLVRKLTLTASEARTRVERYQRVAVVAPTISSTIAAALDLAAAHRLQIFDAIILAASAEAGCRLLLSEDMQDGFVWRGVTVANPFAASPHPMLTDLMRD